MPRFPARKTMLAVTILGGFCCVVARGTTEPADLVIRNASIYTADAAGSWGEALAVRDGILVYVGADSGVGAYVGSGTRLIDAGGRLVLPGFQDAHIHPLEAGSEAAGQCILMPRADAEEYIPQLQACSRLRSVTGWVLGWGHGITELLEADRPPVEILDEAIPDKPAVILEYTSHSAWANSRALIEAGIDRNTPDPVGGVILRDVAGDPNGILLETAGERPFEIALRPTPAVIQSNYEGLLWSLRRLARNGITSIADARVYWTRGHLEVWRRAEQRRTLTVRAVLGLWAYPQMDDDQQLAALERMYDPAPGKRLRISQVKLYSDGIVGNTTAALLKRYKIPTRVTGDRGLNYFNAERLTRYVTELEATGFDVHIHAIGDRAAREALDAIESAARVNRRGIDRRHQITHLEYLHPRDVPRFAELGVFADVQTSSDFVERQHMFDEAPLLGRGRVKREFVRLRDLFDSGAAVVLSSDWDVGDLSPFRGIRRALMLGDQSLPDVEAAVRAYTITPARLLRHEDRTGSLEIGKLADLIITDRNIFEVPTAKIADTAVLLTLLEGEEIYRAVGFER